MISENQAQTLLTASSLAYQTVGPSPGSGYQFLQAFPDTGTGFLALVYRNPDTNKCIVAFTGTQPNFQDAYSDLNLGWQQWSNNKDPLFQFLAALKADPELGLEQVDFTGHSLGGALAQYAAYEYFNETNRASFTLTTFNAFGGVQGIGVANYESTPLAGIDVNHFRVASDMVSRLGEGHVGGNVRVIDFPTPNFVAAHVLDQSFLNPAYAGYQLTSLPAATPIYLHVSTGQKLGAALGNLFNNGTYNEFEAGLRTTGALLLILQLAPANEIDQVVDAMFPQYAQIDWGMVRSVLPVSGGAVVLGGAGLILAAGVYEGVRGAADRLAEVKTFLSRIIGESFSSLDTVPAGQAGLRMALYLAGTTGVGLAGSALGQTLQSLNIDREQFTSHLLSGANWINDSVNYLRAQANTAGENVADFSAKLALGIYQEALGLTDTATDFISTTTTALGTFLRDTAHGIGNAVTEFLQDVAGAFDLGRALNFNDVNLIAQAYAAELNDPRLASPIRTALEEAQTIVQRAGQTVVVQQGIGPNPFETAGFDPAAAPLATGTVQEKMVHTFTAYLPYQAGSGGQAVQLKLNGVGGNTVTVLSGGQELTLVNGVVTLVVPEGQKEIQFALRAQDLSADVTVALVAQLVDGLGTATHLEHHEATITAVQTPAINYLNGLPSQVYTGTEFDDLRDLLGAFNYEAHGNGGEQDPEVHPSRTASRLACRAGAWRQVCPSSLVLGARAVSPKEVCTGSQRV